MSTKKTAAATAAVAPVKSRAAASQEKQTKNLVESVRNLQPEKVMSEVTSLQLSLQGQLAGIATAMSNQIVTMKDLDEAIKAKSERIKELHDIDESLLDLQAVRDLRDQETATFEANKESTLAQWAEDESERQKKWKREDEERNYATAQSIQRSKEEFNASVAERKRTEAIRAEELARQWKDREDALKLQEGELGALRARVAQFEQELKTAVGEAKGMATSSVTREYEHKIALSAKDAESDKKLAQSEIAALNARISNLSEQLDEANKTLEETRRDAKEVTTAALQSASGRDSLNELQKGLAGQVKK